MSDAAALIDPRGQRERKVLRLAQRPTLENLSSGTLLFYDNTKMDVGHYGTLFKCLHAGLQRQGVVKRRDHRETIRGKTAADINALARQFHAMNLAGAVIGLADMGVCPAMVALCIAMEELGIPTVCLTAGPGSRLAVAHAHYRAGALCLLPFDIYQASDEAMIGRLAAGCVPRLLEMLSCNGAQLEVLSKIDYDVDTCVDLAIGQPSVDAENIEAAYAHFERLHIGDGLPFVPPTRARVETMRTYCPFDTDEIILQDIGPSGAPLTVRDALVAAVMAGCRVEYMPLVLTALRAVARPQYGLLQGVTTSFGGGHFMLVSGPLAQEVGMHGGQGCLGPGFRANATIGRSVNLALLNVCRAAPGHADLSCLSSPAKYSYCMAEEAGLSPWPLMHEERVDSGATVVMTLIAEAPHAVLDLGSTSAPNLLETIIDCCTTLGSNNAYVPGCLVVLLNPDHARLLYAGGYDKNRLRYEVHARAGISYRLLDKRGLVGITQTAGADGMQKITRSPADVEIVVGGGHGGHSAVILPWALNSDPVYEAVRLPGGGYAKTLEQFRWR